MVINYCLDSWRENTDGTMQAAACEGRSNVLVTRAICVSCHDGDEDEGSSSTDKSDAPRCQTASNMCERGAGRGTIRRRLAVACVMLVF